MHIFIIHVVSFCFTADIESLLNSPLSSALPLVLELCVKEEEDNILLVALDIIGLLIENGLFVICMHWWTCMLLRCNNY